MLIFSGTFGEAFAATNEVHPPIAKSTCSVRPAVTTAAVAHAASSQQAVLDSATSVRLVSKSTTRPQQVRHTQQVRRPQQIGHAQQIRHAQQVPYSQQSPTPSSSPTPSKSPTTREPDTQYLLDGDRHADARESSHAEQEPNAQQEPDPEPEPHAQQEPDAVTVTVRRDVRQALRLGPAFLEQQRPAGEDGDLRDLGLEHWSCWPGRHREGSGRACRARVGRAIHGLPLGQRLRLHHRRPAYRSGRRAAGRRQSGERSLSRGQGHADGHRHRDPGFFLPRGRNHDDRRGACIVGAIQLHATARPAGNTGSAGRARQYRQPCRVSEPLRRTRPACSRPCPPGPARVRIQLAPA